MVDFFVLRISISTDEDALEGLTKLQVENGVDDWIDERIDVTQPSGQLERRAARLTVTFEFRANGVHDVTREEGHPTNQEHTLLNYDNITKLVENSFWEEICIPRTMASVLVALRSFLADDFSRFLRLALFTL